MIKIGLDFDNVLVKDNRNSMDALDSFRLAAYHYGINDTDVDYSSGGGSSDNNSGSSFSRDDIARMIEDSQGHVVIRKEPAGWKKWWQIRR